MPTRYLIILFTLFLSQSFAQKTSLFPIRNGQLWGFINANGREVIKPQFYSVGEFTEGLCPARRNGTYGYIDSTGKYIIQSQFDYALPFDNGQAQVFIDAKPYIIDKTSKIKFQHPYKKIFPFGKSSYTRVQTHSKKMGVINIKGELVADTVFKNIAEFVNDVSIVTGLNDNNSFGTDTLRKEVYEVGVIDAHGKWLVQYGTYDFINQFVKGYAIAEKYKGKGKNMIISSVIIDDKGSFLYKILEEKWCFLHDERWCEMLPYFNNGLSVVEIISYAKDSTITYDERWKGAVNIKGELVFSNPDFASITRFSEGRAFAEDVYKWHLINMKGETVNGSVYEDVLLKDHNVYTDMAVPFHDGIAIVKTDKGWCGIDTLGKIVTAYQQIEDPIDTYWPQLGIDNILIIQNNKIINHNIDLRNNSSEFKGVWNVSKGTFINIHFSHLKIDNPEDPLISVQLKNDILAYINQSGKIIWKEAKRTLPNKTLNIDYRLVADHGRNIIGPDTVTNTSDIPALLLQPAALIVHNVPRSCPYDYMLLQARDKNGIWRELEYTIMRNLGCTFGEEPEVYSKHIWSFDIPAFEGEFKTKMRVKFFYGFNNEWDGNYTYSDDISDYDFNIPYDYVYSNEIDVQINPGQLWRRRWEEIEERFR